MSLSFVVIAGDISPIDVISHIPVACEDHKVPYAYVPSRFVSIVTTCSLSHVLHLVFNCVKIRNNSWLFICI